MPILGAKFIPGETLGSSTPTFTTPEFGVPLTAPPTATRTPVTPVEGSPLRAFGNLSAQLGGGQYSIGQTEQEIIKSERTFDALTRSRLRSGVPSKHVGVDHIIPLWAGGTNDPSNIQILPTVEMDKKSTIDNLVYQLYRNNYVSLGQSRLIVKNWNSNPLSSLSQDIVRKAINDPSVPETVTIEDKTYAIKDVLRNPPRVDRPQYLQELTGGPGSLGTKIFNVIKKPLNVVEAAIGGTAYGIISAFQGKNPIKAGIQYGKDVLAGKEGVFNQAVFKEAGKGVLSGATGRWLSPEMEEYASPIDQTTAKIARMGGEVAGMLLGFKAIGGIAKKLFVPRTIAGTGIAASELPKTAKLIETLGVEGARIPALTKSLNMIDRTFGRVAESALVKTLGNTSVAKVINNFPLFKSMVLSSGLFTTYGQLSKFEENTLEARAKQFLMDLSFGTFFGALGYGVGYRWPAVSKRTGTYSIKNITAGTLTNAFAGWGIAKIEGADDEDALLNGGIFAALHGFGLYQSRFAMKAQRAAQERARNFFQGFGTESKMRTPKEVNDAIRDMRTVVDQEIADGRMTKDNAAYLLQQGVIAAKTLTYPMMSVRERFIGEWQDMRSVLARTAQRQTEAPIPDQQTAREQLVNVLAQAAERRQPTPVVEPRPPASNIPNELVQHIARTREVEADPQLRAQVAREAQTAISPQDLDPLATERLMSTGMAESINSQAHSNMLRVVEQWEQSQIDPTVPKPETYLLRRDLTNYPEIPSNTGAQMIEIKPNGSTRHLGWVASEENIRTWQNQPAHTRPPLNLRPFNPQANDQAIGTIMGDLGVSMVRADIEYARISTTPEGRREPYMVIRVSPERWSDAVALERVAPSVIPQPVAGKSRKEYFAKIEETPSKVQSNHLFETAEKTIGGNNIEQFIAEMNGAFGNILKDTPELRKNLPDLTYGELVNIVIEAKREKKMSVTGRNTEQELGNFLEQFKKTHGQTALNRFMITKIASEAPAPTTPVPEAIVAKPTVATVPPTPTVAPTTPAVQPMPPVVPPTEAPVLKTVAATVEPVEPRVEMAKQETRTAKDPLRIFVNKTVAEGKQPVSDQDFSNFGGEGNTHNAFNRIVANKTIDLITTGEAVDSPKLSDLYNFNKTLTRNAMQKQAKKSSTYEEFRDEYLKRAEKLDLRLIQSKDQNQLFKKTYNLLRQTRPQKLVFTYDGKNFDIAAINNYEPISPYRNEITASQRELGLSATDVLPVGFQAVTRQGKNVSGVPRALGEKFSEKVEKVAGEMLKRRTVKLTIGEKETKVTGKVFPMADQNGDPGNIMGLFLSDKAQKKLLARYDKDPKKYDWPQEWKDALAIEPVETSLMSDNSKIYAVIFKDIVKANSIDTADFLKRINIFDARALQWNVDGMVRIVIVPDRTLKEISQTNPETIPDHAKRNPARWEKFMISKFGDDGGNYGMLDTVRQIQTDIGFPGENMNIKGTLAYKTKDGFWLTEKSNTSVISEPFRERMRANHNHETLPNTIYTFPNNIKTGIDTTEFTILPGTNGLKMIEVPRRALRYIYENPPKKGEPSDIRVSMDEIEAIASGVKTDAAEADSGTFSLSLGMKFSNKDAVMINGQPVLIEPYLEQIFFPNRDKFLGVVREIKANLRSSAEIIKENYGITLGWGELKKMADANFPLSDLMGQTKKVLRNILENEVLRNREMNSGYLKFVPDNRFFDPVEGKWRMLRPSNGPDQPGEIMISRDQWRDRGRPEHLLIIRYPTLSKLAITKVKVLVAEDYGISNLGYNQQILNVWDTFLIKQADHDGDGLTVFRIISKERTDALMAQKKPLDGIPEPIADHIEQERWKYIEQFGGEFNPEMITVPDRANPGQTKTLNLAGPESKYPKLPPTAETLVHFMKPMADAKQQIGGITNAKDIVRMLIDNGFTFEGRSPSYTPEIENATGALAQAAVDAPSRKVFGQLKGEEGNPWAAIFGTTDPGFLERVRLEIIGGTEIDPKTKKPIYRKGTYINGLRPLRPSTSTSAIEAQTLAELKDDFVKLFLTTMPSDPSKRHFLQKYWEPFLDMPDFREMTNKVNWDAHDVAVAEIKADLKALGEKEPLTTKAAQEFIDGIKAIQKAKGDLYEKHQNIIKNKIPGEVLNEWNYLRDIDRYYELYYDKADQYTLADKRAISWFITTDPMGNTWFNQGYKRQEKQFNFQRPWSLALPEHTGPYVVAKREYLRKLGETPEAPAGIAPAPQPPTPQPSEPVQPIATSVAPLALPVSKRRPQTVATSFKELGKVLKKPQTQFPKVAGTITTKAGVKLTKETNPDGSFWLEQNVATGSEWARLAKQGHKVEHLILPGQSPTGQRHNWGGKVRVDGTEYTYDEARTKFNSPAQQFPKVTETLTKTNKNTGFQGYKGGFDSRGKGTPEGDGKDKAMREVAEGFIGEIKNRNSSSMTSAKTISNKTGENVIFAKEVWNDAKETGSPTVFGGKDSGRGIYIMLARNSEFANQPLDKFTKDAIKTMAEDGAIFVVGDMPNVDSQFIDYLNEIGAKYTIYHTGQKSRI